MTSLRWFWFVIVFVVVVVVNGIEEPKHVAPSPEVEAPHQTPSPAPPHKVETTHLPVPTTKAQPTTTPPKCSETTYFESCNPDNIAHTGCIRIPPNGPICKSEYCPRNCSGRGSCAFKNWETTCACDSGYIGEYCTQILCPKDCSGFGRCDASVGVCYCFDGYAGIACNEVLCPNNCTSNGMCDLKTGKCSCNKGFTGPDCSQAPMKLYQESWGMVFALSLTAICLIVIFMLNVTRFKWMPDSITAILLGVSVGCALNLFKIDPSPFLVHNTTIFLFFLPLILFESGFSLQRGQFFYNIGSILVFSVFGTIISTIVVSLLVYTLGHLQLCVAMDMRAAFTFGALISAVDPVATLAIFHALKAESTLYMLAFGESVLNDAVSIVLFETFRSLFYIEGRFDIATAFLFFLWAFFGSILIGVGCGLVLTLVLKYVLSGKQDLAVEVGLVGMFAYLPYMLASSLRMSGIMAILSTAIIMAHYAQHNLSDAARIVTRGMSSTVAFTCETFMFAYIGLSLTLFSYLRTWTLSLWCVFLLLPLSRACNIFPLARIINIFRSINIPTQHQIVMWFSGLRGIIAFSLALSVPGPDRDNIAPATILIVVISIIVFGGGTHPLMQYLTSEAEDLNLSKGAQSASTRNIIEGNLPVSSYESLCERKNWFEGIDEKYLMPFFRINNNNDSNNNNNNNNNSDDDGNESPHLQRYYDGKTVVPIKAVVS